MRRRKSSKPNTYTESTDVYAAGISVKECAHYPGRSAGMSFPNSVDNRRREASLNRQKSAEDIIGGFDPTEGRNMERRMRALSFDGEGETE